MKSPDRTHPEWSELLFSLDHSSNHQSPEYPAVKGVNDREGKMLYALGQQIGEGGFASVQLGFSPLTGQLVAIKKEVLSKPGSPSLAKESELLQQIHDPNIPGWIDFVPGGTDPTIQENILITEYVHGHSLRLHVEQAQETPVCSLIEIQRIMIPIAQSLSRQYEHIGVVHRDIKPANILIEQDTHKPILVDFGSAKGVNTHPLALGLHYHPPEVFLGFDQLTHKSDLYSLGVTMYELLTGALPYGYPSRLGSQTEIAVMIVKEPHRPITSYPQDLLGLSDTTVAKLDKFFTIALAKNPAERFQNGNQMAEAVGSL